VFDGIKLADWIVCSLMLSALIGDGKQTEKRTKTKVATNLNLLTIRFSPLEVEATVGRQKVAFFG